MYAQSLNAWQVDVFKAATNRSYLGALVLAADLSARSGV